MDRREFCRGTTAAVAAMLLQPLRAIPAFDIPNAFAAAYKDWAVFYVARQREPGLLNAAEVRAWGQVKSKWNEMRRYVESQY